MTNVKLLHFSGSGRWDRVDPMHQVLLVSNILVPGLRSKDRGRICHLARARVLVNFFHVLFFFAPLGSTGHSRPQPVCRAENPPEIPVFSSLCSSKSALWSILPQIAPFSTFSAFSSMLKTCLAAPILPFPPSQVCKTPKTPAICGCFSAHNADNADNLTTMTTC